MKNVYVIGTCDTKNEELVFLRSVIQKNGNNAKIVDVGTSARPSSADISNEVVASAAAEAQVDIQTAPPKTEESKIEPVAEEVVEAGDDEETKLDKS